MKSGTSATIRLREGRYGGQGMTTSTSTTYEDAAGRKEEEWVLNRLQATDPPTLLRTGTCAVRGKGNRERGRRRGRITEARGHYGAASDGLGRFGPLNKNWCWGGGTYVDGNHIFKKLIV